MDSSTAGLIGVGIGGIVSLATALLTPRVNARLSERQFGRETERKKLESLEAVLDDAGVALEEVHWALREALVLLPCVSSSPAEDKIDSGWEDVCRRMAAAQAQVSCQGTRLAIRLGAPAAGVSSPCVEAYNGLQNGYRDLVRQVRGGRGSGLDVADLQRRLDTCGDHQAYLNQAAVLLKPRSV
jgi:gas vesicle protein